MSSQEILSSYEAARIDIQRFYEKNENTATSRALEVLVPDIVCGVRRASKGEAYFYISDIGEVEFHYDQDMPWDHQRFELGNYFFSAREAAFFAEKTSALFRLRKRSEVAP